MKKVSSIDKKMDNMLFESIKISTKSKHQANTNFMNQKTYDTPTNKK